MNIDLLKPTVTAADIAPERLANNPALTQNQKIAEASRQFEAILLKQVLDASQKTVIKSKYSDESTSASIYHDMVTSQLSQNISKSGKFGLSRTFEQQLERHPVSGSKHSDVTASPTASALHHRAGGRPIVPYKKQPSAKTHSAVAALKSPHERTLTQPD